MPNDVYTLARGLREFFEGITRASGGPAGPSGPAGPTGPGRGGDEFAPAQFPPGGIDFMTHELRVRMSAPKTGFEDIVTMTGAMVVQRADPYLAEKRRRQIDFKVLSWTATGWSEKLGAALTYVLSENVDQPVSTIVAEQEEFDFPASINFRVIFDARINNETLFRHLEGRPEGTHFRQVPPTGNRALSPTITRFTDLGEVRMVHPDLGDLVVKPIDCNDQHGQVLRELPGRDLIAPLGLGGPGGPGGGGGPGQQGGGRRPGGGGRGGQRRRG